MSVLRENLESCIEVFQTLLKECQNDGALIDVAKKKWKDDHVCRVLVMACRTLDRKSIFPDPPVGPSPDDEENTLTNRNPKI